MGEASEAADRVVVGDREFERRSLAQSQIQADRTLLVGQTFAVLKGQVEELPADAGNGTVVAPWPGRCARSRAPWRPPRRRAACRGKCCAGTGRGRAPAQGITPASSRNRRTPRRGRAGGWRCTARGAPRRTPVLFLGLPDHGFPGLFRTMMGRISRTDRSLAGREIGRRGVGRPSARQAASRLP